MATRRKLITAPGQIKLPRLKVRSIEPYVPTEEQTQRAFIEWVQMAKLKAPELALLFHPANGGYRSKKTAATLKLMGVIPGVPDIMLPLPRGQFAGLAIEFKRQRTGRASASQQTYMDQLAGAGRWLVVILTDWQAAQRTVLDYLASTPK